jgi:hypothetical protein
MRWVLAIMDANALGDMIAEIAPEAREPKEALLLAAETHELVVLAVGPLLWGRTFQEPKSNVYV